MKTDMFCEGTQIKDVPVLVEILDALDKDLDRIEIGDDVYIVDSWKTLDDLRTVQEHKEHDDG